ncbi:50S ribosomal protein L22 [Candidatus Microgenomates bacterium]|nr:50S ribosomal protein L22 [Candidatus Microgenomates bacterium]
MDIKAKSQHVRMSPRKVRLVVDGAKGLSLQKTLEYLILLRKRAAKPLLKTINSAIANATANFKLKEENLKIKSIEILKGPVLKRWRPVSRGRAHPYKKRTSHIKVILEESKNGTKS